MAEQADKRADRPRHKLRAAGPVRVTLPAKVAYDPDALKESVGRLLERLGCPQCFSGADCLFEMERSFVVNPERGADPDPYPWVAASGPLARKREVSVALAPEVKYDIDRVFVAIDKVIDLIGPHPCISGFDTLFRDEIIVVNPALEAQQF